MTSKIVKALLLFFLLVIYSCREHKIIYAGFNDLVVGSQQIMLYENQRFFLELSLGGIEGYYKKSGDIVTLFYDNKPLGNWPDSLLITKDYFELFDMNASHGRTKIHRNK
jgi:hypothetical protein